jgi:HAD superfamily hydrolase (TIGR01509 family)
MTWLWLGPITFDADLVIFDKDGTLIDFDFAWGRLTVAGVERLVTTLGGNDALRRDLYRSMGYDPQTSRTDGTGPLATASMERLYTIAATVLYQHGFGWDKAEAYVENLLKAEMAAIPLSEVVRPAADVKTLVSELRAANVRVAVVTTDDRSPTQQTLMLLGIENQVDFLACGDDQIRLKPAPDAVVNACAHVGVEPACTLVVGDTVTDMLMAERAGAGCRAGVLTGAGSRDSLTARADVVLNSIAEIHIARRGSHTTS